MDRIAILSLNLNGYGTERTMFNLALGFTERGIAVDLVLVNAQGSLLTQVPAGIRLIILQRRGLLARVPLVRNVPSLIRYLRRERPTVLLSAFEQTNIAALWAWRIARVPTRIVISAHFPFTRHFLMNSPYLGERLFLPKLVRRFYPWADAIVAVSQGAADDLASVTGLSADCIQVVYNPVPPDLAARAAQPLDHPWFAPGEPPVILAVGRLTRQKDFPTLIRAFHLVRRDRPARLLILGDGEERAALEELVRGLGLEHDVSLGGFTEHPYPYMARAAVFVLSSAWEALPVVLLEALTLGTPIVATDCDSGPQEILEGGRWGTLVPVADRAALAKAILVTLDTARPGVSTEARARFAHDRIVGQYLNILLCGDTSSAASSTTSVEPRQDVAL